MNMAHHRPTEPGFYYFRHAGAPRQHIWTAQVSDTRASGLFATVYAGLDRDAIQHRSVDDIPGIWFGPLPSPESMEA